MRDMLESMAVFAAVVEAESFTAAGQALGLSKSAVSKHVRRLEDKFCVSLLARTTRSLSLTETGAQVYERCRQIVAEAAAAEADVGLARGRPAGVLRVAAPVSFGQKRLAAPLAAFAAAYPELQVHITLNDRAIDLVEDGFDCAIRIGELADSSLIARKLGDIQLATAASPAYLAAHGAPDTPADLAGHACLGYVYLEGGGVWTFGGEGGPTRRRFKPRIMANNGDMLAEAAVAGLGILHMPRFILDERLKRGDLIEILEQFQPPPRGLFVLYPAGLPPPQKTRAFIDFLTAWAWS